MKKIVLLIICVSAMAVFYAFRPTGGTTPNTVKAVDLNNFDNNTRPQDDFYQYINGGWLKKNTIPASESRWGSFSEVQEFNYKILRSVLEKSAANKAAVKGSNEQKIGDFYATGMDSLKLEKEGMKPLKPELEKIEALKTQTDIINLIAHYTTLGGNPVFGFYAYQDPKNSEVVVPQAGQGGLNLPDRDYYLKDDEKSKKIREEYKKHIVALFKLAGADEITAAKNCAIVYGMEEEFAKVSLSRVERRDPEKTYHKMTADQLTEMSPAFDWNLYLKQSGINQLNYIIIDNPLFFRTLNGMMSTHDINDWKVFFKWNLINSAAPLLSNAWVMQNFNFNSKILSGAKEIKPRWKRVLNMVDGRMGEALGQLYCEQAFTPETKRRCLEMVNNLGIALKSSINNLSWMQPETKEKAMLKLSMFMNKIGYPDKWRDYSALQIDRTSYFTNVLNANAFEYKRMIAKIGKPVDRTEWLMSPPTVNAYYNPSLNEIVFPAGILQPPFYNANADDAINYGGIGAVIGHEMTHGFDDEGRQFDAKGNLTNWWTSIDSASFSKRANQLVDQYNKYTVLDSMHVNGQLTLGENIADMGGITIAYQAFKKTLSAKDAAEKIDGFTPEQRFFIGWAQVWRNNVRDEELRRRLIVDPHSPGKLRCNGPLTNFPEFYEAFGVKPGDKMFREEGDRAKIW